MSYHLEKSKDNNDITEYDYEICKVYSNNYTKNTIIWITFGNKTDLNEILDVLKLRIKLICVINVAFTISLTEFIITYNAVNGIY